MSRLPQFRDTIAAATETLRSLSSLESRVVEAADLIEQVIVDGMAKKKLSLFRRFFGNLGLAIP
jgi:hypothetical protein